jgi:RNA polymerase sigma-70 factor (ECF subfamily)
VQETRSDPELVAAAAAGNAAAFAALFRRRRGEVYRFALHMTGSPAAADDITQDVFLAVIREAGKFEPGRATVTAWLCGIARNYARRRWDAGQWLAPLPEEGDGHAQAVADDDPEAELARAQRLEGVRRAILRLPFKYREVIVLCDLQEMTYEEAAAALGCAVGTVRSRLHRGRALLGEKLLAQNGKEGSTWHRQFVNTA